MKYATLIAVLAGAFLFTGLFYHHPPGINLFLFELTVIAALFILKSIKPDPQVIIWLTIQLATCASTVVVHSGLSYQVHFLVSFVFIGVLIYPGVKSTLSAIQLAFYNTLLAQKVFLQQLAGIRFQKTSPVMFAWNSRIFLLPVMIILLFITMYRQSNPKFFEATAGAWMMSAQIIEFIFNQVNIPVLVTFIVGLIICNQLFFLQRDQGIFLSDKNSFDDLWFYRKQFLSATNKIDIRNELNAALFLLAGLNLLLLTVNIIDIRWVWFGFEWQGNYLKQFVHEGTYLLIISILISIAIVIYFFRGAINYTKNKYVFWLSYIWLAQNVVLAVSVGIRNYHYIEYFNLAYKRIGVIIFLILVIIGLVSVFVKVLKRKSSFFLYRTNFTAFLIVLVLVSFINWDIFIARYNFAHQQKAFIHFNYLAGLSRSSLPYLDHSRDELKRIQERQKNRFPEEKSYISPDEYYDLIASRKRQFIEKWQHEHWLSWNYADYSAYQKIKHPAKGTIK